nr:phage tail tape measure protein [uncultured Mediterranean phage uvMED]
MANYGVDIELKLKGLSDLKQFDKALKSALNTTNSLEKSLKRLGQINPFTAAGVRRTPLAIAGGQDLFQTLDVQKSLIKLKQKGLGLDQDSIRENNRILNQRAEEFTKNQRLLEQEQKRLQIARRRRRENAISSAIIGGGFPLLFGQGPGAALGGALGGGAGGLMGGQMGFALSIAGTAAGSAIDQFVGKITELAESLKSTESIFSALESAGYKVNDITKEIAASYEEAGLFADAYQLAIDEINKRLGDDGAAKLQAYQDELDRINDLFEDLTADLMVELLPALTGTTRLILGLKSAFDILADSPIFKFIADAARNAATNVPGAGGALQFTLGAFQGIQQLGAAGEDIRTPDSVTRKQQSTLEQKLADEINRNNIARERLIILDKQLDLAVAGSDILNKDVQLARERLIDEKYNAAVRGSQVTEGEKAVAQKTRALELQKLTNEIAKAETAEQKRQLRVQKKINDAADRERKRKENAFKRNEEALLRLQQRGEQQREQQAIKEAETGGAVIDRLSAERELRLAILDGTEEEVIKQQRIEELMTGQEDGMRGIIEKYVELESAEVKAIKQAEQLNGLYASIGQTIETGVVDMITAATDKTKSLAEAASNTLRQLASQLLRFGINAGLGGLGGNDGVGFFSRLFPRALGGSVSSSRPYMVGERGPELFIPGAQGNIVPNHAMGSSNIVVNVDASGTQAQGDQPNAKALGSAIGAAVQAELIKQKRPGGLLA